MNKKIGLLMFFVLLAVGLLEAQPDCGIMSSPSPGASNVDEFTDISWGSIEDAVGYRINIRDGFGDVLVNNEDVGNTLTYDPAGSFDLSEYISVTVTPYDAAGALAQGCTESSFRTRQGVYSNAVFYLDNQTEVDAFPQNVTWVRQVNINGSNITDLSALSNLRRVDFLNVKRVSNQLTSLYGLHRIKRLRKFEISRVNNMTSLDDFTELLDISDGMIISYNDNLTDISKLAFVLDGEINDLSISSCDRLANLNGLENITKITTQLRLSQLDVLSDISGLSSLTEIQDINLITLPALTSIYGLSGITTCRAVQINNTGLLDFAGLEDLTTITSQLYVGSNADMESLEGLESLSMIGGQMFIGYNPKLENLNPLAGLTEIGIIYVGNNSILNSIDGLANVDPASVGDPWLDDLVITDNPSLSECSIRSICGILDTGGDADISNNGQNCNSASEIQARCEALPVTLMALEITTDFKKANLTWSTATETNNAHYKIQRSQNGEQFTTIGQITGAGTTTTVQNYTYTDHTPLPGTNYYRLRQVDYDGTATFSAIRSVNFAGEAVLRVFPNPVNGDFATVQLPEAFREGVLAVLAADGRMLLTQSAGLARLPTAGLPSGVYLLRVSSKVGELVERLVVR